MADSSDEYFTFNCNACLRDGDYRQAVDYCRTCEEYLCQGCLKIHNKLAMTRDHSDRLIGGQVFVDMTKSRRGIPTGTSTSTDDLTFSCNACATGGAYRRAVDFCGECSEYFCDICLQNHNRWTNHSGRLFGERDVQNMIDASKSNSRVETVQAETDQERMQSLATGSTDADEPDAVRAFWGPIVGDQYDVIQAHITKSDASEILGLRVADNCKEQRIDSLRPDGAVASNGILKPGDLLLEANGERLYGQHHWGVVQVLRNVGIHVHIVCARRKNTTRNASADDGEEQKGKFQQRMLAIQAGGRRRLTDSKSTEKGSVTSSDSAHIPPLNWSKDVVFVEIEKTHNALGFSIVDYPDPSSSESSAVVVRNLVWRGQAQKDGRLMPGDRLVSVNGANLEKATLLEAARVLKETSRGMVKIGIRKAVFNSNTV